MQELLWPRGAIAGVGMTGGGLYACEGGITTCALGVDAGDECLDDALLPQPPVTTWGAARAGASPSVPRLMAEAAAWGASWMKTGRLRQLLLPLRRMLLKLCECKRQSK